MSERFGKLVVQPFIKPQFKIFILLDIDVASVEEPHGSRVCKPSKGKHVSYLFSRENICLEACNFVSNEEVSLGSVIAKEYHIFLGCTLCSYLLVLDLKIITDTCTPDFVGSESTNDYLSLFPYFLAL